MEFPSSTLRETVEGQPATEEGCETSLEAIEDALAAEIKNRQFNEADMPAIYAWSSLVSFSVGITYGPASRMKFGGFAAFVAAKISQLCKLLLEAVSQISAHLGEHTSFGISVGFPWGVSVGLTYDVSVQDISDVAAHA